MRQNIINFLIFRAAKSFKGYLISKHSIAHFFQLKWLCIKYKRNTGLTSIKYESWRLQQKLLILPDLWNGIITQKENKFIKKLSISFQLEYDFHYSFFPLPSLFIPSGVSDKVNSDENAPTSQKSLRNKWIWGSLGENWWNRLQDT